MTIYAIADLHLCFSCPEKTMEVFGPKWKNYQERIEANWKAIVGPDDLVLIPGDISWAQELSQALIDLQWIDRLPGSKLLLKGNHDSWWTSHNKLSAVLPPSMKIIHNNAFTWKGISIGGTRLWDTFEYGFDPIIPTGPKDLFKEKEIENAEKVFQRELHRLEMSLKALDQNAKTRIVMTHYPPIGLDLAPSRASKLLEQYKVSFCLFGHLHGIKEECKTLFGHARGIHYILCAADFIDFAPLKILEI